MAIVEKFEKAQQAGTTPPLEEGSALGIMWDNIRWLKDRAPELIKGILDPTVDPEERKLRMSIFQAEQALRKDLQAAARDAAPFIHRRLAGEKPLHEDRVKQPVALIVEEERTA